MRALTSIKNWFIKLRLNSTRYEKLQPWRSFIDSHERCFFFLRIKEKNLLVIFRPIFLRMINHILFSSSRKFYFDWCSSEEVSLSSRFVFALVLRTNAIRREDILQADLAPSTLLGWRMTSSSISGVNFKPSLSSLSPPTHRAI